jgi:hypothetical protein
MIDHVARCDRSDAPWPCDRGHTHPRPVLANDLRQVGQAVVDAHDVAGLDASKPHEPTRLGSGYTTGTSG